MHQFVYCIWLRIMFSLHVLAGVTPGVHKVLTVKFLPAMTFQHLLAFTSSDLSSD